MESKIKKLRALTPTKPKPALPEPSWIKLVSLSSINFVGEDVIAFGADQHILLVNYETKQESIYVADNEENGDGVACVAGHPVFPLFAFAETRPTPRIFVVSCPEFGKISILKQDESLYKAICFSETEHLIALKDSPNYNIQVWYWRSQEMLVEKKTHQRNTVQVIGCGTTLPPTVCQLSPLRSNLILWELHGTVKLCKLIERRINIDSLATETPINYTFGIDGTLYLITSHGNVFHVYGASGQCNITLKWDENAPKLFSPSIVSYSGGVIVSGPDGVLKYFKKIKGNWIEQWKYDEFGAFIGLSYNSKKDLVIGTTYQGEIYTIQVHEETANFVCIKEYSQEIIFCCFLKPLEDFVVTVNARRILHVWKLRTGEKISSVTLEDEGCFKEHPTLSYLILGDSSGILHLINIIDVFQPAVETKYFLSHEKIKEIAFHSEGSFFAILDAANNIYILKLTIGHMIDVVQHFPTDQTLQEINFLVNNVELTLMSLILDTENSVLASDEMLLISSSYDQTEIYSQNLMQLPKKYISVSPIYDSEHEFYGIEYMAKEIHILRIVINDVIVLKAVKIGILCKQMSIRGDLQHTVVYGVDGKLHIYSIAVSDNAQLILQLHNRFFGGIQLACVDKFGQYALTLGYSGVMVCTKLNKEPKDNKFEDSVTKENQDWRKQHSKDTTEGFVLLNELADKRWLDIRKLRFLEKEEELNRGERNAILDEFYQLRDKLKELIDNNERMPVAERIELDVFNIANEWTKIKAEEAAQNREIEEESMDAFIEAQSKVNEAIVKQFWESMEIKGCQIRGIFTKVNVDNFPLVIVDKPKKNAAYDNALLWRKLEVMASCKDEFLPWIPIPANQLEMLLSREPDLVANYEENCPETVLSLTGTRSFHYINPMKMRYQQMNIVSLTQIHLSQIFANHDILRLRNYFNKLFNDLHLTKEDEMDSVSVTNRRLRYIRNELKQLAELKNEEFKIGEPIDDPIFFPSEQPATIIKVEDDEVGVMPYISPSKQKILDALAVEKERLRQEMMADDFRDRALVAMMDGVLEHRWEDEIKKPVWKPACMLEKDSREYDEQDLEAVRDYHKRVKQNLVERDQYKEMLIKEKASLKILLKERITNFNYKVAKLQLLKLQIDSCINAEELRLLKILNFSYQRICFDRQEEAIRQEIEQIRNQLQYLGDTFSEIQEKITEFKNNYETLNYKDKQMDKQFKANFAEVAPLAVVDPSYKIFRRRPKYQIRAWATVPILLDLAKRIVSKKTFEQGALLLPIECVDYMRLLDQMDTFTGATGIDANVWQILCRMRRAKIESEFKLKAYGLQLAEADTTANAFSREMHHKRNFLASLETKLENLLEAKQKEAMNRQLQLIMKRGQIEIDLTGKLNDFKDCILIHKQDIYDLNEVIQKAGQKKLVAMMNAAVFRRKIIIKEWEHKVLRLTVRDMKDFVQVIDKCKITKEVQMWLKRKERGWTQNLDESAVEADIKNTIASQEKMLNHVVLLVKGVQEAINAKRRENKKLDKRIQDINLDIAEQGLKRNLEFIEVEHKSSQERMEFMIERSRLIRKIQEQHSYILELSTMTELQKLRTFPTLTAPSNLTKARI